MEVHPWGERRGDLGVRVTSRLVRTVTCALHCFDLQELQEFYFDLFQPNWECLQTDRRSN